MRHLTRCLSVASLCLAGLFGTAAHAGVVITGTRVIYPAQSREVTVGLTNDDKKTPRLVQTWIDNGNEKLSPDQVDVPFNVTPPVFRMEPGSSQSLRIVYTKEPLPADKESLFWLNVLEVPPKPAEAADTNTLQFAFRIRIKMFFRPDGLRGKVEDAPKQLIWTLGNQSGKSTLTVQNPTPYYISFQNVGVGNDTNNLNESIEKGLMVAPGASLNIALKQEVAAGAGTQVQFKTINDFGGFVPFTSSIKP
ncbi:fimbrial biogenesis chaperone [Dyella mobilis]|uniref:Fimbria/pilus periplasmic chaperone n=1 Tax=Dyella mobilis TaxID=1849582 RepID=A0ABS2KM07_9GAMM|nr:fimbria/pilus periplasmic chaperone [Dyella mobilis]MBM7132198.1 fimbria/pilus periplasmic chaperone [Dyella mobilis]GLQ95817.1 fimbria-related chaperone [Dyella mobilis]